MKNFAFPYFSRNIAEFWRRWHISLSTWFRDYLYIPLGGSRGDTWVKVRNIFLIFIVSGFWHGANWTFIIWGTLNALYCLPIILLNKNRLNPDIVAQGKYLPSIKEFFNMSVTFSLTVFAWIFFRSENIEHGWEYINEIFSKSFFTVPYYEGEKLLLLLIFFIIIEWIGRESKYAIENFCTKYKKPIRWTIYIILVVLIILYNQSGNRQFIYFQF